MDHITLFAQNRSLTGKAVKRLRKEGVIPIVVYGGTVEGAIPLQVNERDLNRVLRSAGAVRVIDLQVDGTRYPVLTREVQRHPTRHAITHVDFLAVRLDQLIQAEVRIVLIGEATALETSLGVLSQVSDRVMVEALPEKLPGHIDLDISDLSEIGQMVTVADLPKSGDYTIISDPETLLIAVVVPTRAPLTDAEESDEAADLALSGDSDKRDDEDEDADEA